jgi:hypothetical protein
VGDRGGFWRSEINKKDSALRHVSQIGLKFSPYVNWVEMKNWVFFKQPDDSLEPLLMVF